MGVSLMYWLAKKSAMPCKTMNSNKQKEPSCDGGGRAAQSIDVENTRLDKEMYFCLCEAIEHRSVIQAETLLIAGANPKWLARKKFSQLRFMLAKPIDEDDTIVLPNDGSSSRVNIRIRRPWTGEEANRLAYENSVGDWPALKYITIAACRGFVFAQHDLAVMLESGEHAPQRPRLAFEWYRIAAEGGDPFAQNNFANMVSRGKITLFDGREVVKWYRKSAKQNCPEAMVNLAFCLLCGKCAKRNEKNAFRLSMRSFLLQQTAKAACIIGKCFRHGWGTPKDAVMARSWLGFAKERGCTWDKCARRKNQKL